MSSGHQRINDAMEALGVDDIAPMEFNEAKRLIAEKLEELVALKQGAERRPTMSAKRLLQLTTLAHGPEIKTIDQAKAWVRNLVRFDMAFHLEDDPSDIVTRDAGEEGDRALFPSEYVDAIRIRRDQCYAQSEWGEFDCPIGFMMAVEAGKEDDPAWDLSKQQDGQS